MRTTLRIAALVLGGAMFIGCDNKDNTAVTPPTSTPPAVPDTSKVTDAAKNAADSAKTGLSNAVDSTKTGIQNATDSAKTEANKLMPSTMPAMPAMPK